ncbi:MAG: DNA repair protein RadC [Pseudomonadota bacterium]|nr:DNA repair protein RadC [Alcanivorax sp. KX64203]MEC7815182.1 DNA repair protein RadC [Pseudomonadota bacterium]
MSFNNVPAVHDGALRTPIDHTRLQQHPIVREAIGVLESELFRRDASLSSPVAVREYLRLQLVSEPLEVFAVIFLDNHHGVIAYEPLFRGTIDGAAIYPRAVVRRAIEHNCSAVIFAHNHPSGDTEPSRADRDATTRLKAALDLVDVRVLDHFIIGKGTPLSFAEEGYL